MSKNVKFNDEKVSSKFKKSKKKAKKKPKAAKSKAAKSKDSKPITLEEFSGMASASWNLDGLAYLLIGGDAAPTTQTEAQAFETWALSVTNI
jgi:hypothetical protein